MKNYLDEAIFAKYIMTVFEENRLIVLDITPLSDDCIEPKFKVDCIGGTYFAKYSSYNKFSKELFEMKELESLNGRVCLLPFVSKNLTNINKQLNIYDWVDGETLRSSRNCNSTVDVFNLCTSKMGHTTEIRRNFEPFSTGPSSSCLSLSGT